MSDDSFSSVLSESRWDDPDYCKSRATALQIQESMRLELLPASLVRPENINWVYAEWVAKGELTIIAGPPNVGKSTLLSTMIASVTTGATCESAIFLQPLIWGHVLIVDAENDIASTIVPRLIAAGADCSKVHFVGRHNEFGVDEPFSFSNSSHLNRLKGHAKRLDNRVAMIVIDPIYAAVVGDANNNVLARKAYEGLAKLAKDLGCAIVGIAHTGKSSRGKEPLDRVAGPPALRQVPRSIMLALPVKTPELYESGTCLVVHAKNNIGTTDGGYAYRIQSTTIVVQGRNIQASHAIVTHQLHGTAFEIIANAEQGLSIQKISKREVAVNFLQEVLKDGPRLWRDVESLADGKGITKGTLLRAKSLLKLVTRKREGDGYSEWSLPSEE